MTINNLPNLAYILTHAKSRSDLFCDVCREEILSSATDIQGEFARFVVCDGCMVEYHKRKEDAN